MEQIDTAEFRALLKTVRRELESVIAATFDTHNVSPSVASLKLGACSFDPTAGTFTFKLEGQLKGAKGKDAILYEQLAEALAIPAIQHARGPDGKVDFRSHTEVPGITLPPLGTFFSHKGARYEVIGANRGSKVLCKRLDGKTFLFKPEGVARLVAITNGAA